MIAIHNIETLTPAVPVAGDTHGMPSARLVMHPTNFDMETASSYANSEIPLCLN